MAGCAPKLNAGEWQCPNDGGTTPAPTDPVAIPWSTSFEDRFCDYTQFAGDCYGDSPYTLTTEQAHPPGRFSAEFYVDGSDGGDRQTRCIRRGVLPDAAFYGAWYYIPAAPTGNQQSLWNLFHFNTPTEEHLWDVTLVPEANSKKDWDLQVYDAINGKTFQAPGPNPIPIGTWFHIEFFLKRASDATGAIKLYRDGTLLAEANNLKSDYSKLTAWYVGNLAENIDPPDSILFVDDVSISATR